MKQTLFKKNGIFSFFLIQIGILTLLLLALLYKFTVFSTICFCLIIILCFLTYFSLYIICKDLTQQAELEAQNTVLAQHNKLQKEHMNALKENEKIWNLIKKYVIETYQSNEPMQKNLRVYIDELINRNSILYNIEYCDNRIIDAILYNKILYAKTKGIHPIVQVLVPNDIPIRPVILMTVYSNLIDNAIEATEKLPEKDRFINIESAIKAKHLIIKVENNKLPDDQIDIMKHRSTKRDTVNHGLGLQILQKTCKEHHGSFTVNDQGSRVTFTAVLQLDAS